MLLLWYNKCDNTSLEGKHISLNRKELYFMFIGYFKNRTLIICESILIVCSIILFSPYNRAIMETICKATQIPYDLALTVTSVGFGNINCAIY